MRKAFKIIGLSTIALIVAIWTFVAGLLAGYLLAPKPGPCDGVIRTDHAAMTVRVCFPLSEFGEVAPPKGKGLSF